MSATLLARDLDARVERCGDATVVRLSGALVLRNAPEVRRALTELIARPERGRRMIVDLGALDELDTAGIAAVTAPAFEGLRQGFDVAVLPPVDGDARLIADRVGVFPIGRS